jgi:hypothetical protein
MSAEKVLRDVYFSSPMVDPGASGTITVDRSPAYVPLDSAAAETRTLAAPSKAGALVTIAMRVDTGDITLTVTGNYNEAGDSTFTFSDPGQFVTFQAIESAAGTFVWRKVSDYGLGNIAPGDSAVLDDLSGLMATAAEINARAAAASRIVNVTDAATYTVLAADSGKIHIMPDFTSSCTLALPAVSAGLEYTFIGKGVAADAQNWIFQSAAAANFYLGGVSFADTDDPADTIAGVYSNGSSNDFLTIVTPGAGTRIHMICDGTNWIVNGQVVSATTPAFSDT